MKGGMSRDACSGRGGGAHGGGGGGGLSLVKMSLQFRRRAEPLLRFLSRQK